MCKNYFFVFVFLFLNNNTRVGGNSGPEISALLTNGAGNGGTLHLTLGVDNDTSIVLEVKVDTILSSPGLRLADNNGGHDLLTELRLTLLDGSHNHVANTGSGKTVESGTEALDGNDAQVAGTRVVAAVNDSADGETELKKNVNKKFSKLKLFVKFFQSFLIQDKTKKSGFFQGMFKSIKSFKMSTKTVFLNFFQNQ